MSLYSLLQIEKVNCVDGYQYLRRLMTELAKVKTGNRRPLRRLAALVNRHRRKLILGSSARASKLTLQFRKRAN